MTRQTSVEKAKPSRASREKGKKTPSIGTQIRKLRKQSGLTLAELAGAAGLSISAVSKIENEQVSPTVVNLMRLTEALDTQIADLLSMDEAGAAPTARMATTRSSDRHFRRATDHEFFALCTELQHKLMRPMITKVHPKTDDTEIELVAHSGEEFVYVLKGVMDIRTEYYQPVRLKAGDCIYLDSTMAHRYVAIGKEVAEALVVWVPGRHLSNAQARSEAEALTGQPG